MLVVVNMIPNSWSGEINQDAEPNLTVNPANPSQIVGTAFTYDNITGSSAGFSAAMVGALAPLFVSTDGGNTWTLSMIVPSQAGAGYPTLDITVRFGGASGILYAGIINAGSTEMQILRTDDLTVPMTLLAHRAGPDQPYVQATTVMSGPDVGKDRVYVGNNDLGLFPGMTATVDRSLDAATAAPPAGFNPFVIEQRNTGTAQQDGPQARVAIHTNGTIYAVFYHWFSRSGSLRTADVVVVRDDNWGSSATPFTDLLDVPSPPGDGQVGRRVASGITIPFLNSHLADFGQERLGGDLAIAVDPNNSQRVYIVYADATGANDYTLHVRRSLDGGGTWSTDLHTVLKGKNPGLAVNNVGEVGFLYQQVVGPAGSSNWVTHFERTTNDFATIDDLVLANTPSNAPAPAPEFGPYLGDYDHLLAVGSTFYGVFSASNTPDPANFPAAQPPDGLLVFQRNHTTSAPYQLLDVDNVTPVQISIDPFFFKVEKVTPTITWPPPGAIVYGSALPSTVCNATASVPGTFTYTPPCGTCPLPAGTQTLSVTFTPDDTLNFNTATATVPLTVLKATPTITWPPPPDIDQGDPLPNSAFPTTNPTWVVCGTTVTVSGNYTFAPAPGTLLPVGTHTLTAFFMPTDTLNYNPVTATAQIHVLTGSPIILSCSFAPTTLQREERTQVTVIVKNDSVRPHLTQGPDPGFEYSEGDTFQTKGFPSVAGAYRIAVDLDMTPYPYKVHYLYRWGFGHTLAPGESVAVNGFIRFHNSRENAPYFVAMIQEVNSVVVDHQCPTLITVERP